MRVGERLDGRQRRQVVEVEVCAGEEGGFEGAQGEVRRLGGAEGGRVLSVEGAQSAEEVLEGLPGEGTVSIFFMAG